MTGFEFSVSNWSGIDISPDGVYLLVTENVTNYIRIFRRTSSAIGNNQPVISVFKMNQNYPNPFNPSTNIEYSIPKSSDVEVSIYNLTGQKLTTLVNKSHTPGNYQITWNGSEYASGVYIYQIRADNFVQSKKMLLIR